MAVASVVGTMQHGVRGSQVQCQKAPSMGNASIPQLQRCPFTPTAHLVLPRSRAPIRAVSKTFSCPGIPTLPQRTSQAQCSLKRQPECTSLALGNFRKPLKGAAALQSRHSVKLRGVLASAVSSLVLIRGGGSISRKALYGSPLTQRKGMRTGRQKQWGSALASSCSADLASGMFTFGTAMVVPFYTLMLAAPTWRVTRKVMDSALPYVVLGAMYMYLLFISWTPEHPKLMFSSKYWLPELPGITRMFSSMLTVSSAWIHLLAVDLFAGRNIYLDSITHNLPCRHSLVLCLMFGPVGIFSHLFTKNIVMAWRKATKTEGDNRAAETGRIAVFPNEPFAGTRSNEGGAAFEGQ